MRGNSHVRFLGEEVTARSSPYPTWPYHRARHGADGGKAAGAKPVPVA